MPSGRRPEGHRLQAPACRFRRGQLGSLPTRPETECPLSVPACPRRPPGNTEDGPSSPARTLRGHGTQRPVGAARIWPPQVVVGEDDDPNEKARWMHA